ncbi:DNA-cytosine methyltransferase protein [Rhizobium phage RHph_N17]|nr:DNA-cytosine methyltransferase protein [Rhizobium phage RHph_N17]
MKIAVLFDGAGLARLGLEQAGHECHGFELDPWKHHLSTFVGSGNCTLADVRDVDLSGFDAVWASPPCQEHSIARTQGPPKSQYSEGALLKWAENLETPILWVENVDWLATRHLPIFNAAQFLSAPIQNRSRRIGGRYKVPDVFRPYTRAFPGICPCITASEYRGCASDKRRASRYYGRRLTVEECAYHQGFTIPDAWHIPPSDWVGSATQWLYQLYEAVGNGVPVYMAWAFGEIYEAI